MNILIIGSGGREHALAWKFAQDSQVNEIFIAPGNAGTAQEKKCQNITLTDVSALKQFALDNDIGLTMVGSEELLAQGIVDEFQSANLKIFGPHQAAAQLEASKAYAKQFMLKHGIKTADYQEFTDIDSALQHLTICDYPTVIKADGLAAGKGVIIAENQAEAEAAVMEIMSDKVFGSAGDKVVIEEFLICPNPFVTDSVYRQFIEDILNPTLTGLQADNLGFSGVIFFGLMINERGVFLLEYNMRMGDPETQTVLPLLNNSLTELVQAGLDGKLAKTNLSWKVQTATCVVAASKGYPENYDKGMAITGTDQMDSQTLCFIAGAVQNSQNDGSLLTSGGRVLNVVSLDDSREKSIQRAYDNLQKIHFQGMTYRKDIGKI